MQDKFDTTFPAKERFSDFRVSLNFERRFEDAVNIF